jgi:hypothetical protein
MIDIWAVFGLEGGVEQRWYRARALGRVVASPYVIDPPNGKFELTHESFDKLP